MIDLALDGCHPEPLGSYLKALAVLRLVTEQKDANAKGHWKDDAFHLSSTLDADQLATFLARDYAPTPIVGPWGARSGFYPDGSERSARDALVAIEHSTTQRLADFRATIAAVRACLASRGLNEKAKDSEKLELLAALRNELPDTALRWLDAAYVLGGSPDKRGFPIILGTGGNEGSQGFSSTFMKALLDVGILASVADIAPVRAALFGDVVQGAPTAATGQFAPGATPDVNQGHGFFKGRSASAWDMILTFEGAATWISGATKRTASSRPSQFSSPFTVRSRAVGFNAAAADELKARGEIWLPIWTRPSLAREVEALLAEGRAQRRGRGVTNAVDLAKAIGALGIDRGIAGFERHAVLDRHGKMFFAIGVGRFNVFERAESDLVRELDIPFGRLDRNLAMLGDEAPRRLVTARRKVEQAVFELLRTPDPRRMLTTLRAVGRLEETLSTMDGGRNVLAAPLAGLSPAWIAACPDSVELRIAAAIASIMREGDVGSLRANLVPIDPQRPRAFVDGAGQVAWEGNSVAMRLGSVLRRRLLDGERLLCERLPLTGRLVIASQDVIAFLEGRTDDALIEDLLFALSWIDWNKAADLAELRHRVASPVEQAAIPTAYALLKSVLDPGSDARETRVIPFLLARHVDRAIDVASARLRAAGLRPVRVVPTRTPRAPIVNPWIDPVRLAASLLVPIRDPAHVRARITRPSTPERTSP